MELQNLHRQPSNATATHPAHARASTSSSAEMSAGVRAAVSPEEWARVQKENDSLDKMVHRLAYQVEELKESQKDTKARADKYKQQLKEQLEVQRGLVDKHSKLKAQTKALVGERDSLQARLGASAGAGKSRGGAQESGLAECRTKLAAANAELKTLKAEVPEVQKLLAQGGEAVRKLQALEGKENKRIQELQKQLAETKAKVKSGQAAETLKTKNQQLQSDMVAMKERLKAAATQASSSISQVQACKDMLTKAEEVLRTCSELHASKGDPLASALQATTSNLEAFLKTLNQPK